MLTQIRISQFTVVDSLDLEFSDALTVLTGETGAGKSIIIDALGLCLGDRADPSAIRPGSDRAEISAAFAISGLPRVKQWLEERDLDAGDECLFRRVITREGRSRAYINGQTTTLQDCSAVGELLIDIHGQHAHQSLLRRGEQRVLLDAFGSATEVARTAADLAERWHATQQTLEELLRSQHEQADREQLLRYQVSELDELALSEGEVDALENEQRQLANAETMQLQAGRALDACDTNADSVRGALSELDPELHTGARIDDVRQMLESAAIQLDEARAELQQHLANCESNPQRLAEVESRLDRVYELGRKHRVNSTELIALQETLQRELEELDTSDERLEGLREELTTLRKDYDAAAKKLTAARKRTAKRLQKEVAATLEQLAMANCRFEVALTPRSGSDPHSTGNEDIELLISTNPGAKPQSLGRVASGGELSRISLAIQVATAGKQAVPSMIFDEVDVGIGGGVAEVVGRLLAGIASQAQVICVTHLPQVAAQGRHHLRVSKSGDGKQVSSTLKMLSSDERVDEIARMLGGLKMTKNTLAHAREMLEEAS